MQKFFITKFIFNCNFLVCNKFFSAKYIEASVSYTCSYVHTCKRLCVHIVLGSYFYSCKKTCIMWFYQQYRLEIVFLIVMVVTCTYRIYIHPFLISLKWIKYLLLSRYIYLFQPYFFQHKLKLNLVCNTHNSICLSSSQILIRK